MHRAAIGSAMAAAFVFGSACRPPAAAVVCAVDDDCPDGWHCNPVRGFCFVYGDAGTGDIGAGDPGAGDTGASDAGTSDTGASDAGAGDTGASDVGTSDTGASDAGTSDTGASDTGASDTGASDTGASDNGASDTGIGDRQQAGDLGALDVVQGDAAIVVDGAASDTGRLDRRNADILLSEASRTDLERVDAIALERGAPDAGACTFGALVFDGVDDRVSIADQTGMDDLALFTIETWIKQTGSTNAQRIFSRHKTSTFTGYTLSIVSGRPQFEVSCVDCPSMVTVNANGAIATGTWHHLAAVVDGTHAMLFVDGVRQTQVQPWGGPTTATYTAAAYLGSGVSSTEVVAFPFNGAIDSVRLSSTNRFTDDFTPVRHALTVDSATIALWNLDEGAGQIAVDAAGDHDGLLGGTAAQESTDPSWRSGMCVQDN